MFAYVPMVGAHTNMPGQFVDIALAAAMSWNIWYCLSLLSAADVIDAAAIAALVT